MFRRIRASINPIFARIQILPVVVSVTLSSCTCSYPGAIYPGVYSAAEDWMVVLAFGTTPPPFLLLSWRKFPKISDTTTTIANPIAYLRPTNTLDTPWTPQHIRSRSRLVTVMPTAIT